MRRLACSVAFLVVFSFALSSFQLPREACAGDSVERRMFVYSDSMNVKLFEQYCEGFFKSFYCDSGLLVGTCDFGEFYWKFKSAFADSGEEDFNVVVLAAHGQDNGMLYISGNPESYVAISPELFRDLCDSLNGTTVIITAQCFGGEFAERFWGSGSGREYADSHYAIYALSGTSVGYLGQMSVFMFPFGKSTWEDYVTSYYKFGSEAPKLVVAPVDTNNDGYISLRELYGYSSLLQYRFAQWASNECIRQTGDGNLECTYPLLYGGECLDIPILRVDDKKLSSKTANGDAGG